MQNLTVCLFADKVLPYISKCLAVPQLYYGLKSQPWALTRYPQKDNEVFFFASSLALLHNFTTFPKSWPKSPTLNRLLLCLLYKQIGESQFIFMYFLSA